MATAALAGGLALSWEAGPASADDTKPVYTIGQDELKSHGINPSFIVAVHLSDGGGRLVLAEHRPGKASVLHVFDKNGGYQFGVPVPSPQLVDFFVEGDGQSAFLVGSLGTRFYVTNLKTKKTQLVLSSLPDRPGFRALTPVTIVASPEGPAVYGLFYKSDKESRDLGFARIDADGSVHNLLSTAGWERDFGRVLAYAPHPEFKGALVVHQAPKGDPKAPATKHLSWVPRGGTAKELDSSGDIFGATWTPDGAAAVYVRRSGSSGQLMMRVLPGSEPVVLAEGRYFAPKVLAKRRLVVSSMDDKQQQSVWIMDVPAGQPAKLELPGPAAFYSADPSGTALAAWGPWGVSAFRFGSGS